MYVYELNPSLEICSTNWLSTANCPVAEYGTVIDPPLQKSSADGVPSVIDCALAAAGRSRISRDRIGFMYLKRSRVASVTRIILLFTDALASQEQRHLACGKDTTQI